MIDQLQKDIRHAVRGFRRTPGFTLAVVLTMALGIGSNTAIFSVVDQLLLRPLPYPEGDDLLMVYESLGPAGRTNVVSPANWLDWQRESRTLGTLAAWNTLAVTLTGAGEPARLNAQVVSSEFFPLLGVRPFLGRTVSEDDDRPGAPRVVVLSHRLWTQRFGADPDAIGRVIQLNDRPAEIVGVMPAGFRFVYQDNDLWGAFQLDRGNPWRDRSGRFINVVARLSAGATMAEARQEMDAIAGRLERQHVFNRNTGVTLVPLREELTGQVRASLLVLYAAVAVLLSIAGFNITSLLLARAASRRREIAIRTAVGGTRRVIVRQLLVESLLLALAGGALGILLARWSLDALMAFAPAGLLRVPELLVDRRVLSYALVMTVATGAIVGLVPGMLATRRSIAASLRTSGAGVTHSPRVRQALVVFQVPMTVVLLCGAGLLLRTVIALNGADSGFDKRGLVTMDVGLPGARYPPDRRTSFYADAVAALRALPGVESAAAANSMAIIGTPRGGSWFHRLGTPELPLPERPYTVIRVVTPGYFRTLRVPVLRGREFTEGDEASPNQGFIVNDAFVEKYLADTDPLGVSLTVWMQERNPYLPIIGVVGNVGEGSVRDRPQPTVFYSHRQMPETGMTLFVRTDRPAAIVGAAAAAIRRIDPNLAVTGVQTFEGALADSIARERLSALVSGAFALSGLLLASLGLYGLLAFLVAERTQEIGVRLALGAQLGLLVRSVVGDGLRLAGIGAAIGIGFALVVSGALGPLLFGVSPHDPWTYASVLLLIGAVAAAATAVPARRAARVDPAIALRAE